MYVDLPAKDQKGLAGLWTEVLGVESIGAWKSFSALTGQLVEAMLREKLLLTGSYPKQGLANKALGALVQMAHQAALISSDESPPTSSSALTAARTLRNWASHASLWYDNPSERSASQSLVLSVCVTAGLFPRATPTFADPGTHDDVWILDNLSVVAPGVLLSRFEATENAVFIDAVRNNPEPLYTHVVRHGAVSSVAHLIQTSHHLRLDQDRLRDTLVEHFADIVVNASRSSFKPVLDVVQQLRLIGLESCAALFSILLPFDIDLFLRLLTTKSKAWVARYVGETFRAEPRLFGAAALNPTQTRTIVATFWDAFRDGSSNILNMANILGALPSDVRAAVLREAPEGLLPSWIRRSEPRNAVNIVRSLNNDTVQHHPDLAALQLGVLDALISNVQVSAPSELHECPLRIARFGMACNETAVALLRAVLAVASKTPSVPGEWIHVRRIAWDCYVLIEPLKRDAIDLASSLLMRQCADMPPWVAYTLGAIVDLEGEHVSWATITHADDSYLLLHLLDPELDRWQRFAGALAYARVCEAHGLPFPVDAVEPLSVLRRDTILPELLPSRLLLERVDALLAHYGD